MPSLHTRVSQLYSDLGEFPPGAWAERPVIGIYNTLLTLAQKERQGDAVLSTMSEVPDTVDAATLRVLVGQTLTALSR